ncbi:MAG TPA: HAMP domain-containing sensor histidine kinase [Longimicrobium sp.]|nr:HAMP domain-containing sensor histidine kinase [Longimicrobium sp.]
MSLRKRIVLTLVGITVILAIPAAYGLVALNQLHQIAHTFQARDAEALLALGRMQQAVVRVDDSRLRYAALIAIGEPGDTTDLRMRGDSAASQVTEALGRLAREGYAPSTRRASTLWDSIQRDVRLERALLNAGQRDSAAAVGTRLRPAFARMDQALDPIASAIEQRGAADVERAELVARRAETTTLTALALALAATIIIGALLTRTLLRPIGELRRGMATVAQGDFEPDVRVPDERTDELGDLARSFETMTEQLRELDRLKAEFVSVASHEIKTPLSVIRGYVTLLADGIYGEVNEQQHRTLEAVSAQTDRLARLVHRLLDVSRFEAGGARLELREIDLRAFFDDLTADFRVLAVQNGIEFPVRLADDLPPTIVGDEDRLSEVLGNLLSNAFKFTEAGGTIRVEAARYDGGIQVEVEDTGVGIAADKLPRIFEKFYQVENDAQPRSVGSGLGLAIAREIVEAHGGTIGAESQEGKGTRFRVFLPERPPAQERS